MLFDWHGRYLDRPYLGRVVENNDPKRLGRIKVDILLYEGIDKELLPWCYPFNGNGGGGAGVVSVPEIGNDVLVMFPYLDIHFPFYVPVFVMGSRVVDLHSDYPKSYGFKDKVGNMFRVNKESNEILLKHVSGTRVRIDSNGNVEITSKNITMVGDLYVDGNVFATGSIIDVGGNTNHHSH